MNGATERHQEARHRFALGVVVVLLEVLAPVLATGFAAYILLATGAAMFASALTFFLIKPIKH